MPSVDMRDVLQSIDRDLDYYRNKLQWLYKYSLVSIPIVLAVYMEKSPIMKYLWVDALIVSIFFIGIMTLCSLLRDSLVARIYQLLENRDKILFPYSKSTEMSAGFFTKPRESIDVKTGKKTINPSKIYIFAITLVSLGSVFTVWLRVWLEIG